MTKRELVEKLRAMREEGDAGGRKVAMTQLFGILFNEDIEKFDSNANQIANAAREPAAEMDINSGRNLAGYVTVKPELLRRWRQEK